MNLITGILGNLLYLVVPLAGLILIAGRVRGTARSLGMAGCGILVGTGVLQIAWVLAAPQLFRALGGPVVVGFVALSLTILSAVGLGLLVGCAVTGRGAAPSPAPFPPQGPPQTPPWEPR